MGQTIYDLAHLIIVAPEAINLGTVKQIYYYRSLGGRSPLRFLPIVAIRERQRSGN
jgi:hypothetical protein